jgi:hypothetical protein
VKLLGRLYIFYEGEVTISGSFWNDCSETYDKDTRFVAGIHARDGYQRSWITCPTIDNVDLGAAEVELKIRQYLRESIQNSGMYLSTTIRLSHWKVMVCHRLIQLGRG